MLTYYIRINFIEHSLEKEVTFAYKMKFALVYNDY
jgi:hypothetical protein